VTYLESALEKKLSDIPETELVAKSPEYGEENDVCRKLEIVERRSGSVIESMFALATV
jgi:hypothetical protein